MDVLLLDDDDAARHVVRTMLERNNYTVHESSTAERALKIGSEMHDLALLVAAVNLHLSSGIEVALQLRARVPTLKIILISTAPPGTFHGRHRALHDELPPDSVGFQLKPFTYRDLFRAIHSFPSIR